MSKYNDDYYIVFEYDDAETVYLKALRKTADRDYEFEKMRFGLEPLFFENAYKKEDIKRKIERKIRSVHMNMNFLLINNELRDKLKFFDITYFQLYPAVIIDDNEHYHENYWFFNIYNNLDCIDYDKSIIRDYEVGDKYHDVNTYYLSDAVLDKIPEEERLIFRPANTDIGFTFVHQKIVNVFNDYGVDTLRFMKVSEWEMGKQFR